MMLIVALRVVSLRDDGDMCTIERSTVQERSLLSISRRPLQTMARQLTVLAEAALSKLT